MPSLEDPERTEMLSKMNEKTRFLMTIDTNVFKALVKRLIHAEEVAKVTITHDEIILAENFDVITYNTSGLNDSFVFHLSSKRERVHKYSSALKEMTDNIVPGPDEFLDALKEAYGNDFIRALNDEHAELQMDGSLPVDEKTLEVREFISGNTGDTKATVITQKAWEYLDKRYRGQSRFTHNEIEFARRSTKDL